MEYPWYDIIESSNELLQGDLIKECPIVIPPISIQSRDDLEVDVRYIDSVILSQSCDLVNSHIDVVLVCQYYPLRTFLDNLPDGQGSFKKSVDKSIENLRKGYLHGYHLLNKNKDIFEDYQVVDFRNVYGVQLELLKNLCGNQSGRVRLLPPYREHLSQSFARYFMRVGLPQDIVISGY
jgi:hypothetical protein